LPGLGGADISIRAIVESAVGFGIFVKFLLIESIVFYLLSYIDEIQVHLGITPGSLIPSFKIWTLFTYSLIDVHLWTLFRNLLFIFLAGKYIEPLWGSLELLLFYLITNIISGLWVTLLYLLSYMSAGNEEWLFETRICGMSAFIGGILVAMKQLLPEEVISSLPFLHIRVKHLPFTLLVITALLVLFSFSTMPSLLLYICGTLVSWIYLRFYQLHTNTRGDLSDGFTFASFFPEFAQPAVAVVANTVHGVLVKVGVCKKMVKRYDVGAPSAITLTLSPAERADNDRRRQLALKALGERLGHPSNDPAADIGDWPALDSVTTSSGVSSGSRSTMPPSESSDSKNSSSGAILDSVVIQSSA
jgi:membrane associated rhomboid family serine protease